MGHTNTQLCKETRERQISRYRDDHVDMGNMLIKTIEFDHSYSIRDNKKEPYLTSYGKFIHVYFEDGIYLDLQCT